MTLTSLIKLKPEVMTPTFLDGPRQKVRLDFTGLAQAEGTDTDFTGQGAPTEDTDSDFTGQLKRKELTLNSVVKLKEKY